MISNEIICRLALLYAKSGDTAFASAPEICAAQPAGAQQLRLYAKASVLPDKNTLALADSLDKALDASHVAVALSRLDGHGMPVRESGVAETRWRLSKATRDRMGSPRLKGS